jgi:hypothetical protein
MSWALKHSSISLPAAPRASPDRFASEPPSIGRSERSSVIDSFMLGTTQSAPFVGPGWSDGQKLPTNFAEDPLIYTNLGMVLGRRLVMPSFIIPGESIPNNN